MGIIRNPASFAWRGIIKPLLIGWLILVPLSFLIRKKRGLILFIGLRNTFSDNVKYLYLHASSHRRPDIHVRILMDDPTLAAELAKGGFSVVRNGTLGGWWAQLRACIVVADSVSWIRPLRFHAMFRALRVQLWHGCPLKHIERNDRNLFDRRVPWFLRFMYALSGRFATLDLLLSPSPYFSGIAFANAFRARKIVAHNYPRNDVFWRDDRHFFLGIDQGVQNRLDDAAREGLRCILYMPTFRDHGGDAVSDGAIDPAELQRHAEHHGLLYVFKLHPVDSARIDFSRYSRIVSHDPNSDVYPLLKRFDLLVTDYSSVLFDFLHCDRPVVFFAYDLERYKARDRELYFDYDKFVPGMIVRKQDDLQQAVIRQLGDGGDTYAQARRELLNKAFAHRDGKASSRLWSEIMELVK